MNNNRDINLVAFAGRKSSGKSTLAQYLGKLGYEKKSFADHIKYVVGEMFGVDKYTIQEKKEDKIELIVEHKEISILSKLSGFDVSALNPFFSNTKIFYSYREALQYIATDVLRNFDNDYHVKKTLESLSNGGYYVIDDMRFMNEKKAVNELGGKCYFVVNPSNMNISNHESEISLNWSNDFDYIILNNSPLEEFVKIVNLLNSDIPNITDYNNYFINYSYKPECRFMLDFSIRNAFLAGILYRSNLEYNEHFGYHLKNIEEKIFLLLGKECDGKYMKNEEYMVITNPLVLENLKAWGFYDKNKKNSILNQKKYENLKIYYNKGMEMFA
jgi:energy-coupling factor transporter ATP-binding protein EcfA2